MLEPSLGQIKIDEVDISKVQLHDLRSKITVISQLPVLYDVSIRDNLDPSSQLQDRDIWEALERTHLKKHVLTLKDGLDTSCDNLDQFRWVFKNKKSPNIYGRIALTLRLH